MSDPLEFFEPVKAGLSVWVSPAAIDTMLVECAQAGRKETGGILIGRYQFDGRSIDIVETTPKPKGSGFGWSWFQRSDYGLAAMLEARWKDGWYYLGEWHFHPGSSPSPSTADLKAMRKIASDPNYHCPQPVLVILGGDPQSHYSISITVITAERTISMIKTSQDDAKPI